MLIPLRTFVIPQLPFTTEELTILDGPTASAFVCSLVVLTIVTLKCSCIDFGICWWRRNLKRKLTDNYYTENPRPKAHLALAGNLAGTIVQTLMPYHSSIVRACT